MIGTFIATLELVKRGVIRASQEQPEDEIVMEFALEGDSLDLETHGFESEFDDETEGDRQQPLSAALEGAALEGFGVDAPDVVPADNVVSMQEYRNEPRTQEIAGDAGAHPEEGELDDERREVGGA